MVEIHILQKNEILLFLYLDLFLIPNTVKSLFNYPDSIIPWEWPISIAPPICLHAQTKEKLCPKRVLFHASGSLWLLPPTIFTFWGSTSILRNKPSCSFTVFHCMKFTLLLITYSSRFIFLQPSFGRAVPLRAAATPWTVIIPKVESITVVPVNLSRPLERSIRYSSYFVFSVLNLLKDNPVWIVPLQLRINNKNIVIQRNIDLIEDIHMDRTQWILRIKLIWWVSYFFLIRWECLTGTYII